MISKLINRLSQMGFVSYDLLVRDDSGNDYRHSISLPLARDTGPVRAQLLAKAEAQIVEEQKPETRRQRFSERIESIREQRANLQREIDRLQEEMVAVK